MTIKRLNRLPTKSFLLLGPRGTGKSTWLKSVLPNALNIDLLDSQRFLKLRQDPSALASLVGPLDKGTWVIIDEIQRVPELLNEVHRLYETKRIHFALSGSSARKLRRDGANLLAGRAIQKFMFPFVFPEYKNHWTITDACEWGTLPLVVSDPSNKQQTLSTYVETYLKEEIAAEALVRNLDPFIQLLRTIGLYNAQILNIENLSRESGVKRTTVERYFQILEDTLLTSQVPAIKLGIRTKETTHPKFFMFDTGLARAAAGLLSDPMDSISRGFAFEAQVYQELRAYNSLSMKNREIFHYAVSGSFDVDFLVETSPKTLSLPRKFLAIEVKSGSKFKSDWLQGIRVIRNDCPKSYSRGVIVYQGSDRLKIDDIEIVPAEMFFAELHDGKLF